MKHVIENTLKDLQNIVREWSEQFENPISDAIHFHATRGDLLAVNGIILCPINAVDAKNSTFDTEVLELHTTTGSSYEVGLNWTFDGQFEIGYVKQISTIYSADSQKSA